MVSRHLFDLRGEALSVRLSHQWARALPVFDEGRLVSHAGLVPVMALAEAAGLSGLIESKVRFSSTRVKSAGVNPAGKIATIVAGIAAGADGIDDLGVVRAGGMGRMFTAVYAPATLGQFLREFTHGHALQLASVLRAHLVGLVGCSDLLPGIGVRALVDIDSLLRPVYGRGKQGASFGHAKIGGKRVLRRGLSPLVTTISTDTGAPVIAGIRLRAGSAGSGRGAATMVTEAIATARRAGATGTVLVRGDAAYGSSHVVAACRRAGARFSLVVGRSRPVDRAIAKIPDGAWVPVKYPGAILDPDTGEWISDAQVAEIPFTAFASTSCPVTARLIVRRVRDRARGDELFPVWRYHPFLTDNDEPVAAADVTHRGHAVIETVHSDLIDGPMAKMPSGRFAANAAWLACAAICHNLLRAAASLTGDLAAARGATLRRTIVTVPARIARPQRRGVLHLIAAWPWADAWMRLWTAVFPDTTGPPRAA